MLTYLPELMKDPMKIALENKVNWILANCEDSLVNIYKKFGVINTKQDFLYPIYGRNSIKLISIQNRKFTILSRSSFIILVPIIFKAKSSIFRFD